MERPPPPQGARLPKAQYCWVQEQETLPTGIRRKIVHPQGGPARREGVFNFVGVVVPRLGGSRGAAEGQARKGLGVRQ